MVVQGGRHLDTYSFQQLQVADWGSIAEQLYAFALRRLRLFYGWPADSTSVLAKGMTVDDVVFEVIEKTIAGTRKWDPQKGDLLPWLVDQVKSEIDALMKSAAWRHERPIPPEGEGESEDQLHARVVEDGVLHTRRPATPETVLLAKESKRLDTDVILEIAAGDRELGELAEAVLNGCEPAPRYLAAHLGVSVENIYNRMKRFRRRAAKYLEEDFG